MKTLIQKLPLTKNSSIIAETFETPYFETPYHQHNEYELMVIKKGHGTAFIGDFIGEYEEGDVYLHGNNLAHWFRKQDEDMIGASMVVQFNGDFLGKGFFDVHEMKHIKRLLNDSERSIFCTGVLRESMGKQLLKMEKLNPFEKIICLLNMLHEISLSDKYEYLSGAVITHSVKDQLMINQVFEFSMNNFKRKIALEEVAGLCNKSVSAFSHYFKKVTKTNYINFLTQIRIKHACELLKTTNLSITEICFESGFNNWANFSKHFKENCGTSPSKFRAGINEVKP